MLFTECVKFDPFTIVKKDENCFHAHCVNVPLGYNLKILMTESCNSSYNRQQIFI